MAIVSSPVPRMFDDFYPSDDPDCILVPATPPAAPPPKSPPKCLHKRRLSASSPSISSVKKRLSSSELAAGVVSSSSDDESDSDDGAVSVSSNILEYAVSKSPYRHLCCERFFGTPCPSLGPGHNTCPCRCHSLGHPLFSDYFHGPVPLVESGSDSAYQYAIERLFRRGFPVVSLHGHPALFDHPWIEVALYPDWGRIRDFLRCLSGLANVKDLFCECVVAGKRVIYMGVVKYTLACVVRDATSPFHPSFKWQ